MPGLSRLLNVDNEVLSVAENCVYLFGIIFLLISGLWLEKGYQERDVGKGIVFTKVLGFADTRNRTDLEERDRKIWDAADAAGQAQDDESLFIMTNQIITRGQQHGVCPEDISITEAHCTPENATNCIEGTSILLKGQGVMTGRCVSVSNSTDPLVPHTCEISGWCPAAYTTFKSPPLLEEAENFMVLMKAFVNFPKFDRDVTNTRADASDADIMENCKKPGADQDHWNCPIFKVKDIIKQAGIDDFKPMAIKGGIIGVTIQWKCNFDLGHEECRPTYSFQRMENNTMKNHSFWNFRYVDYYDNNETEKRDLSQETGIFFVFNIDATAGRFDLFRTLIALGSVLAYFEFAPTFVTIIIEIGAWVHNIIFRVQHNAGHSSPFLANVNDFRNSLKLLKKKRYLMAPAVAVIVLVVLVVAIHAFDIDLPLFDWALWGSISAIFPALLFCLLIYVPDTQLNNFFLWINSPFKGIVVFLLLLALLFLGLSLQVALMYALKIFESSLSFGVFMMRLITAVVGDIIIVLALSSSIPIIKAIVTVICQLFCCCNCQQGYSGNCTHIGERFQAFFQVFKDFLNDMFDVRKQLNKNARNNNSTGNDEDVNRRDSRTVPDENSHLNEGNHPSLSYDATVTSGSTSIQ